MKRSLNGKLIRTAFAASLAVHLAAASFVHAYRVEAQPPERPTPARIFHIELPKPTPTPRPTPPPKVQPRPRARVVSAVRPRVQLVHVHDNPNAVTVARQPAARPTGIPNAPDAGGTPAQSAVTNAPLPSPTPKPACSAPNVDAKAIDPVTPDEPDSARNQGLTGTAKIKVDLDPLGRVVGASVYSSTGSIPLDQAALQAARASRYSPEQLDCKDVAGSYLFTVQFQ